MDELDLRTPVIVGVGQASERIADDDYRARGAADLAADAVRAALSDTGAPAEAVASAIDTIAAMRAFDDSSPYSLAVLGAADNVPRAVAARIGADPARAILDVTGGQSPQHSVTELCAAIASGASEVAVSFGAEVISTVRHLAATDSPPDFTEHVGGTLDDRGFGIRGLTSAQAALHDLVSPPTQYSILENARRARLGVTRAEYLAMLGRLFAPFTALAAANPHAAAATERSADELVTVTDRNRRITDAYPRYLIARDQVNQAAAVVIMSLGRARDLGVPDDRLVFLHGHADLTEHELGIRPDLGSSPAAVAAVREALSMAGVDLDQLSAMDLYSCFGVPVFNLCDGLGLATDDPRGLTVTGGLPFFGGPGNNYSMHAIVEIARRARADRGSFGMVAANGGILSKHSVGIYSTGPAPWRPSTSPSLQADLDRTPTVPFAYHADGPATIESYSVTFDRTGSRSAVVIGRLDDGRRFVATPVGDDEALLDLLTGDAEPIGQRVHARAVDAGNRVAIDRSSMDRLLPVVAPVFRDRYDGLRLTRHDHVLEVTIDRPTAGNAVDAATARDLDEVIGAFCTDDDLRVAIVTGAGTEYFGVGIDLDGVGSSMQVARPINGFAGLSGRRHLSKPVIAAINGRAEGAAIDMVLSCHLAIADESATFALPETGFGLTPGLETLGRLPDVIGRALAHDMILTGRRLDATEAVAAGLVSRVVAAGTVLDVAREMAATIASRSPIAARAALSYMASDDTNPSPVDDELMVHADTLEGLRAHREGRGAHFRNR
ncbi:acetyl-CoA acetyltransferase [Williamsia maris]|uniref:Acetyl-CoA C-acetyltransferase n=1 Tax=Williamsia maris TaxID=72806 RepID=A0ABT1HFX5_9NOCA|nr:acetyl-CoA acetyltransferase [Williamsia maris]MCP2175890.1 acetyl-CoA C-acetyltransferase [Williamsia maris]